MKNQSIKPQIDIEGEDIKAGLGPVQRSEVGTEVEMKDVSQIAPSHHVKRQRFDKQGRPLISKGILIRIDLDKKYKLKAALMGADKYVLINDALEHYYENVLKKTTSQKLKEAGQEQLEI